MLRWFRDRTRIEALGRDHGVSRVTAYRYVAEAVDVLSQQAPGPPEALDRAMADGVPYVILDGKVFMSDRCSEPATSVQGETIDAWYSTYPPRPAKVRPTCAESKLRTHSRRRDARRAMAAFDDRERLHADAAHRTLPVLSMTAGTTSALDHSVSLGILINSKRRRPRISMRRHAVAFRLPITRMPRSAARLGENGLPAETGHVFNV